MKYTLLELTQHVLSSTDGDEINSISDTVESQQVVKIIKSVYDDIIARGNLDKHRTLFTLNASGDSAKPVLMTKPDNIDLIDWVRYNCITADDTDPQWNEINYMPIDEFVRYTQNFKPSEDNVDTMTHSADGFTLTFTYKTDVAPCYYTTFDDVTLIFDSYDSEVDSTLQASKTSCFGTKNLVFTETDTFVPELQADQFSLLLNEAKSLAWAELRQTPHPKAESTARKNWVHIAKTRQHIPSGKDLVHGGSDFDKLPNFSRR